MEVAVEAPRVGGHRAAVVLRQFTGEEEAEHAALAVADERHIGVARHAFQAAHQAGRACRQRVEKARLADFLQRGQTTGRGHRVAAQRAGLVDRTQRRQQTHHRFVAAESGQRHATADDLAEDAHVGHEARDQLGVNALCTAQRHAKPGHHFVEHQQRAVLRAQLAQPGHEGHAGAHEIHVAGDRFDHHAGQFRPVLGEAGFQLCQVVVFQDQRVLDDFGRHAGARRVAEGGQARAGLDQQRIGVAVVAAFELDELAAAGGAARQAQCAHAGFGAAADQPHLLDAGHQRDDGFGQFDFALGRGAKTEPVNGRLVHRFQHRRVAVAQDHRTPRADVVDVPLALGVPQIGALRAPDETRRAAHRAKGAHRRIHATGNHALRAGKQCFVRVHGRNQ